MAAIEAEGSPPQPGEEGMSRIHRMFLANVLRSTPSKVEVYLVNGIKLVANLIDFDRDCIVITGTNGRDGQHLIRWGAISTIIGKGDVPVPQKGQ